MNIITAINFYYSMFPLINLCVEMSGGINGKYRELTKEAALDFLAGYENEEVVQIMFQTHYTFEREVTRKLDIPLLYIMYK